MKEANEGGGRERKRKDSFEGFCLGLFFSKIEKRELSLSLHLSTPLPRDHQRSCRCPACAPLRGRRSPCQVRRREPEDDDEDEEEEEEFEREANSTTTREWVSVAAAPLSFIRSLSSPLFVFLLFLAAPPLRERKKRDDHAPALFQCGEGKRGGALQQQQAASAAPRRHAPCQRLSLNLLSLLFRLQPPKK